MVERATALLGLSRQRALALAALLAALVTWEAAGGAAPGLPHWADVAFISALLIPLTFAVPWLLSPLAHARSDANAWVPLAAGVVGFASLAVVLRLIGAGSLFNVAKLLALTLAGFALMQVFEILAPVVLIAVLIPGLDALSVWRGPTRAVVDNEPGLFELVAINFRVPGSEGGAGLGPPDILFFALFLAASLKFALRPRTTWWAMAAFLGLTLVLIAVFDIDGLPALPAVAFGFLFANLDLLWPRLKADRATLKSAK